jgi:superfamily II DNA or RNA helicase
MGDHTIPHDAVDCNPMTTFPIARSYLYRAAELARQCATAVGRERALVARAVALAIREDIIENAGIATADGRSGMVKYLDLLDLCDFRAGDWDIEVRVITRVEVPGLYIPTVPLMVGVLSDYYLCAQVDPALTSAEISGYACREDLAEAEILPNGLFAVLPAERLRPLNTLFDRLREERTSSEEQFRLYDEWRNRAERIIQGVDELLSVERAFTPEQVARIATGVADDVIRIYGDQLPGTGLEPLFKQLFRHFGIDTPLPSAPESQVTFRNSAEERAAFRDPTFRDEYFKDGLNVRERVSLYRYLLEDNKALAEHRQMKRVLDQLTGGKQQVSPKRRRHVTEARRRRAAASWTEPALEADSQVQEPEPIFVMPPPARTRPPIQMMRIAPFGQNRIDLSHLFYAAPMETTTGPVMDFAADPEVVRTIVEADRLAYGHLTNPSFATEISRIDPLPHQRLAVYEHLLPQPRLRFLLADDAGAGKTIMAGLYIREMLTRRLVSRVLIVSPAGLVGNWKREMNVLFNLPFGIVTGSDTRSGNPFAGQDSDLVIISIDTLAGERTFKRLQEESTAPYSLVIFDEAHKLSAYRDGDFDVSKTDRYKLAEALAGAPVDDPRWQLAWSAHHLLLLTATPHMGKPFPYYSLWRLLEPEALSTEAAFDAYPKEARARHFIRRTKEEMVNFAGNPLYPRRQSDTHSYDLTQGEASEQRLYDLTTDYIEHYYGRARLLNRSAARLAMSVFQRRLASSTYALQKSFERRLAKLDSLIERLQTGKLTREGLEREQDRINEKPDFYGETTADEEAVEDGRELSEEKEDEILSAVAAVNIEELRTERGQVESLLKLARRVHDDPDHEDSKFAKLREVLSDPAYAGEKFIIFTEHRDTLEFLVRKFEGLGFVGQIGWIHGGMSYRERDEMVEQFRRPVAEGGMRLLVATDAAGEGINLQFCWLMINYDIPWNPARLEQRMGRIHRYGQKHDPVIIVNLIAGKTREGRVLKTLLDKLERIRQQMGSDKVFDCIGRLFENVSLKSYLEQAVTEDGAAAAQQTLEGLLTPEQVEALRERDRRLLGDGGDVLRELPRLRRNLEEEAYRRLLPGYARRFFERATPLLDIALDPTPQGGFALHALKPGALDVLLPYLEAYTDAQRNHLVFDRPDDPDTAIWLHPGESLFDRFLALTRTRYAEEALRGGVFTDPDAHEPYLFHLVLVAVERRAEPKHPSLSRQAVVEYRLVGLRQDEMGRIEECPVEYLLLLRGAHNTYPLKLATRGKEAYAAALLFAREQIARSRADWWRNKLLDSLAERAEFISKGYDYQEAELAAARARYMDKARGGDARAKGELTKVKERQRRLSDIRQEALAVLRREPELIAPGEITFLAHALIRPSDDPLDRKRRDDEIEATAMCVARAWEEAEGAVVRDVSTPELARAANQADYPGFDLLSARSGSEVRAIEVKGRAGIGDVELTENEWAKACNLRGQYWLYVVYDCAGAHPRLLRIQDPFGRLLARAKGGVIIDQKEISECSEMD